MTTPQGGATLGTARGYIDLDISGVKQAVADAKNQIGGFVSSAGSQLTQWGNQMAGIGSQMTMMFAPLGLGMAAGIKMASNFDSSLAEIQARAGLTDEAIEEIRATTLKLGADTVFSTQQAADAYLQLLTAGLDTQQALATLPQVLDGAAASGEDLGSTADTVTNVMSSFNMEAEETARIVDAMAQAAAKSPATMAEIGMALERSASSAKQFGLDVEETSAILSIFAQNGLRGEMAGRSLQSILREMTSDTPKTNQAWEMVNSSLFDASGNARDFDTVLSEIRAGMANLNDEQRDFVMQNLAGTFGRQGFAALMASAGINAQVAAMRETATASEVAEARMDTFQGRIISLKGSIETFAITTLTPFMDNVLKPLAETAIKVVNAMTAWAAAHPELVQRVMSFLSVLVVIGPTLFAVGKALSFIGFMLTTLVTPMGLVLAGVAALGAAWTTNFMGIRDVVEPIVERLIQWFGLISSMFQHHGLITGIQLLFTTFEDGSNFIGGFFRALGMGEEMAYALGNAINNFVSPAIQGVMLIVTAFQNAFRTFTGNMANGQSILQSLGYAVMTFAATLGVPTQLIMRMRTLIIKAFKTIQSVVGTAISAIQKGIHAFSVRLDQGNTRLEAIRYALMAFAKTMGMSTKNIMQVRAALSKMGSMAQKTFSGIYNILKNVGGVLAPLITEIRFFVRGLDFSLLISGFGDMLQIGQSFASGSFWELLQNIGTSIFDVFEKATRAVTQFFFSLNLGRDIWQALAVVTENATWVTTLQTVFESVTTPVIAFFAALSRGIGIFQALQIATDNAKWVQFLQNAFETIQRFINERVLPALGTLWNWLQLNIPIALATLATAWTTTLWPEMQKVWNWLETVLFPMFGRLVSWLVVHIPLALSAAALFWNTTLSPAIQTAWEWVQKFLDIVGGPEFVTYVLVAAGTITALSIAFSAATAAAGLLALALSPIGVALIAGGLLVLAYQNNWLGFKDFVDKSIMPLLLDLWNRLKDINDFMNRISGRTITDININTNALENLYGVSNRSTGGSNAGLMDNGGRGRRGQPYVITPKASPEVFVPDSNGTFIPNADLGGRTYNVNIQNVTASGYEEGRQAGEAFGQAFLEAMRAAP